MYFNTSLKKMIFTGCFTVASFLCYSQDTTNANTLITGHTKVEHLENNSEHNWFSKNYTEYAYDTSTIATLKKL